MNELARVTKSSGMCYVNFLSMDWDTYGDGVEVADGKFLKADGKGDVLFCHYKTGEPECSVRCCLRNQSLSIPVHQYKGAHLPFRAELAARFLPVPPVPFLRGRR